MSASIAEAATPQAGQWVRMVHQRERAGWRPWGTWHRTTGDLLMHPSLGLQAETCCDRRLFVAMVNVAGRLAVRLEHAEARPEGACKRCAAIA